MLKNDSKPFIESSNNVDSVYKNIEECKPNKKHNKLIVFFYTIADIAHISKYRKMLD